MSRVDGFLLRMLNEGVLCSIIAAMVLTDAADLSIIGFLGGWMVILALAWAYCEGEARR